MGLREDKNLKYLPIYETYEYVYDALKREKTLMR